ncbi:N-acetyltransferase [Kitasatospora sp. NPDC048540]|uniref:N-acetyltransferase n=1 Tax=Kitasatospora sp. NPDC048540 TaxID=3155634 RepID=UPI003410F171
MPNPTTEPTPDTPTPDASVPTEARPPAPFVPDGFTPPRMLTAGPLRLEPLGPQHNAADHTAWTTSIEHIRATPGFAEGNWPPAQGMTPADNLRDLERHAEDFARRTGFTFSVLDGPTEADVVGCVYVYPSRTEPGTARVSSWVRADRAELDGPLHRAVADWLAADWPFQRVAYR